MWHKKKDIEGAERIMLYNMHNACWPWVLQSQDLRVDQVKKPCIGLTQKNSIENSVQDCLPYIQISNGLCELFLAYFKWPCICLKVNMCIIFCIISSLPECSMFFYALCDLWPCHLMWPAMWQHDLITLILTLVLKIG